MAKVRKRRTSKKNVPHQVTKSGGSSSNINWVKIGVITVGVLIALSMVLSLVVFPGTGF